MELEAALREERKNKSRMDMQIRDLQSKLDRAGLMEETLIDEVNRLKRGGYTDMGAKTECVSTTRITYKNGESGEMVETHEKKVTQHYNTMDGDSTYTVKFTCPEGSKEVEALVMVHDPIFLKDAENVKEVINQYNAVQKVDTMRNVSPPRSRRGDRDKNQKSPRGKKGPKERSSDNTYVMGLSNSSALHPSLVPEYTPAARDDVLPPPPMGHKGTYDHSEESLPNFGKLAQAKAAVGASGGGGFGWGSLSKADILSNSPPPRSSKRR